MEKQKDYTVVFQFHGFTPEMISDEELKEAQNTYVEMYNRFCFHSNEALPLINSIWDKYEKIQAEAKLNDGVAVMNLEDARKFMGINEETDYYDWVEKNYKTIIDEMDSNYPNEKFKSTIYRCGELINYGIVFKSHPKWGLDFYIM